MEISYYEMKWQTVDNQVIPFSEVTHQHWSNIYWYHLIFQRMPGMPKFQMEEKVEIAKEELAKRFKNIILPWKPVFDFEVTWLIKLGMVKEGTDIIDHDGIKIGEILTTPIRKTQI